MLVSSATRTSVGLVEGERSAARRLVQREHEQPARPVGFERRRVAIGAQDPDLPGRDALAVDPDRVRGAERQPAVWRGHEQLEVALLARVALQAAPRDEYGVAVGLIVLVPERAQRLGELVQPE